MLGKRIKLCNNFVVYRYYSSLTSPNSEFFQNESKETLNKFAVTSVNVNTNSRSIVQISKKEKVPRRFQREFNLPQQAIDGLRNVIIKCERPAKQLQNEADQLANKLEQRRFPESPEKLKAVRDEIKKKLKSASKNKDENSLNTDDEAFGGKIKEAQEYQFRNEVDKIMKKSSFNWKPLEITNKEAAASYSLARLAPNYAEIARVLEEFNNVPEFVPKSVLDYGSGSGAGFWAATSKWKGEQQKIEEITMIDTSDMMTRFAMDSIRKENVLLEENKDGRPFVHDNVSFRRHLIPSLNTTYDLIIAHRILCEIGSLETRHQLIESLWKRTNRFLILIESAQPDAFSGILESRDFLLTSGTTVDYQKLLETLEESGQLTQEVVNIINNRGFTDYERFEILKEILGKNVEIPTKLPTATVLAPCPHDLGCPLGARESCSFVARYRPIRADGKKSNREKDGSETTNFSFVILEKGNRQINKHTDRILKNRKLGGHVTCDVCTAFRGIQRFTLSKKHGEMYTSLRSKRDGDILPIELNVVTNDGIFDYSV